MRAFLSGIVLVAVLGCDAATGPDLGRPEELGLSIQLASTSVGASDTLRMRLVARNPAEVPIEAPLPCGHRGLRFAIRDVYGPVPNIGLPACIPEDHSSYVLRVGPRDSVVQDAWWVPTVWSGGNQYAALPPGAYAAAAELRLATGHAIYSAPAAFTVRP